MSEEVKNTKEQPNNSTPEETGGQGGDKLFTQDDVNRIVAERLARERSKGQPSATDQREQDLAQREAAIECRDFLERENETRGTRYPVAELVHLLGARPLPEFKDALREFETVFEKMSRSEPRHEPPKPKPTEDSLFRSAFGLRRKE